MSVIFYDIFFSSFTLSYFQGLYTWLHTGGSTQRIKVWFLISTSIEGNETAWQVSGQKVTSDHPQESSHMHISCIRNLLKPLMILKKYQHLYAYQ